MSTYCGLNDYIIHFHSVFGVMANLTACGSFFKMKRKKRDLSTEFSVKSGQRDGIWKSSP